jgi:myo-inositol 2-dehydrogenase / D-chiro-inositol 1-dehydrogenase
MRIGIFGLGRIGAFHADTLAGLPAIDSLVLADLVPELAERAAAQVSARVTTEVAGTAEALLATGVDGVVVAAGTDAHPALVLAAVAAGVPVFCEKPIAAHVSRSLEVVRQVAASGVEVQIGYQRRFDPAFLAARAAVSSGELGFVHTVRSTTLDPFPPPAEYLRRSGGLFRDCGVHDYDVIRWVTGREVVEVYAAGANRGAAAIAEAGDVDTSAILLTLDDGTLALVSNTRYNARGYDVRLEVHGSDDSVAAGLDDRLPLRSTEPGATFPAGEPYPVFMERFRAAYRAELEAFTEVVAGARTSPCTIGDALEAEWVAEACTLSFREHSPIPLAEVRASGEVPAAPEVRT